MAVSSNDLVAMADRSCRGFMLSIAWSPGSPCTLLLSIPKVKIRSNPKNWDAMVQPWFLFGDLVCIPSLRGCPDKKANRVCCDSGRPSCTVHRRSSCASYIPGPQKWRQCKRWTKNDKGSLVVYKQSRQTKTRALTSPSWWNYSQLTRVVEPCWTPLSHQRNVKTWKWTSYFIRIHSWSSAPDSCFTRFLGTKNASITQPKELIPLNIYIYICVYTPIHI